jgi:hypothetical protein
VGDIRPQPQPIGWRRSEVPAPRARHPVGGLRSPVRCHL